VGESEYLRTQPCKFIGSLLFVGLFWWLDIKRKMSQIVRVSKLYDIND
jgi:hypothetical protein